MKTKKLSKVLISVALVFAMLFSMCIAGFTGVSAAGLILDYKFAYNNAGYAEGYFTLSGENGTYILYWADDTAALEGYTGIAQLTLTSGKKYYEMPANTAIPAGATKVIAVKSDMDATVENASAVFEIPESKQFNGGKKQYDFMALSDVHIAQDSFWKYSKIHFANSLEVAAKRDVEFVTICGDAVNGYDYTTRTGEYQAYQKLIASSNYNNPVYETNGNHEMKGVSDDANRNAALTQYAKATGLNATTGAVISKPYYEKTINGDHYIFLVLEISGSPNESNEFTNAQLDWFEGLLNKYKNDGHKIFVNQHCLIAGYGAGDNKLTPYYGGALQQDFEDVKRLMKIMEANSEIIMMSGHSHIDFKYGYNFDNENGTTCYTVHIPSNSSTTHPNASGELDYTMDVNSSQGYIVDVYEDYVIFNGTDLAFNQICPSYTYMVDYTGQELDKNDLPEIQYDTVNVTVDVSKLVENAESVVCVAVDENDSANTKHIPMTKNEDGTYSAKVIADYSSMYFAINGKEGVKTKGFTVDNCIIKLGYQTLTYTPDKAVDFVRAHVWGDNGDGTTWPGVIMTKSGDSYTVKLPASDYTGVVFNWGDEDTDKTEDLDIADYLKSGVIGDLYTTIADQDPTALPTLPTESEVVTSEATEVTVTTEATEVTTEPAEITTEIATQATEPTETTVVTEATEPTETTTEATEVTTVPIATTESTATTATEPDDIPFYGDADLNGKINVKDATTVQKHTAKMLTLEGLALKQADVTGDGKVNIKDATAIQKYVAKLITVFPVEEAAPQMVSVGGDATLMAEVKNVLEAEYQYASYDAYMALKKAYMTKADDAVLTDAYDNYKAMKSKNPISNYGDTAVIGDISIGQTGTGKPAIPGASSGTNSGGNQDTEPKAFTLYAINSAKWGALAAHVWNTGGSGTEWPGVVMTKTSEKVNGFDVYSVGFDEEYGNIIFNNNDNGSQTATLEFNAGQYFDIKGGKWYTSLDDVPEVSAASTDRYLVGSFNGWSTIANEFMSEDGSVGYVELELEANTTYEFKVIREGKWTSCKTTLSITDSASGLVFSSGVSDNTTLTTKSAGTYVFAFGLSTSQLSVTYP